MPSHQLLHPPRQIRHLVTSLSDTPNQLAQSVASFRQGNGKRRNPFDSQTTDGEVDQRTGISASDSDSEDDVESLPSEPDNTIPDDLQEITTTFSNLSLKGRENLDQAKAGSWRDRRVAALYEWDADSASQGSEGLASDTGEGFEEIDWCKESKDCTSGIGMEDNDGNGDVARWDGVDIDVSEKESWCLVGRKGCINRTDNSMAPTSNRKPEEKDEQDKLSDLESKEVGKWRDESELRNAESSENQYIAGCPSCEENGALAKALSQEMNVACQMLEEELSHHRDSNYSRNQTPRPFRSTCTDQL